MVADGTLARLEARRIAWRARRDAGEVELTALMPIEAGAEQRWAYYVEQPIPADAPALAPASVRAIKLIDPAVGSGHFLVVAFDLAAHTSSADLGLRLRGEQLAAGVRFIRMMEEGPMIWW